MKTARLVFQNLPIPDSGYIAGVAIFDLNGLPLDCFTVEGESDSGWVQAIFQSLGLKSLLTSCFQLQGFERATLQALGYRVVIIRQSDSYVGLLNKQVSLEPVAIHTALTTQSNA